MNAQWEYFGYGRWAFGSQPWLNAIIEFKPANYSIVAPASAFLTAEVYTVPRLIGAYDSSQFAIDTRSRLSHCLQEYMPPGVEHPSLPDMLSTQ